ncbi:hypothetical protein SEA_CECE_197 [Microbacterium phage Cece]|nr:hypothetical protein SEA_CECE_197 [Microbacterium phage Cece]
MNATTEVEPDEVVRPLSNTLNASDRCDQCRSQAFVWVNMPESKAGLLYCGHHFHKNEEKLREVAIDIIDERYKINARSQSAPD